MTLQELLESEGEETTEYSGRGMFGKNCLAVIPTGNMLEFMFQLGVAVAEHNKIVSYRSHHDLPNKAPIEHPSRILSDQLGKGMIVYFPDIPFVHPTDEIDGEENADEEV